MRGRRLIAAFFLSRFLSTILFGITVHDTVTFIAVPACLIIIALLAGYLPARRATKVDLSARYVTSSVHRAYYEGQPPAGLLPPL